MLKSTKCCMKRRVEMIKHLGVWNRIVYFSISNYLIMI